MRALPQRHYNAEFVQHIVARCHFEKAEYQQAVDVYAQCCKQHKLCRPMGLEYYSTALWHLREAVKLSSLAQNMLEGGRLKPEVWCVVGNCFSLQREHEQAVKCFQRAIQIEPSFAYAYTLVAHEYAVCEKFDKAIQMFQRALSIDPRHYNAWWGLGNVSYRQEQYQTAKYNFQKAVNINSSNAVLRAYLGMACQMLNETDSALELFSKAAQSESCSVLAPYHKGLVYVSLGRNSDAIDEFRHAESLAPREPLVNFHLGRAYAKTGDTGQGLLHFTKAIDLCAKDSKHYQTILSAQEELLRTADTQRDEFDTSAPPISGIDLPNSASIPGSWHRNQSSR